MAEGMTESGNIVRASDEHAADSPIQAVVGISSRRGSPGEASPHAQKFRAAIAMLVGFAIGAIAVAVVILASSGGRATG